MPFKSYEELMDMTKSDPKMAMMMVNKAKASGKQVVDESNPGYGARSNGQQGSNPRMDAVKRRMKKNMVPSQQNDASQELVNRRKSMGY
jgi:Ni,Fe-hydrogenase III large subunit